MRSQPTTQIKSSTGPKTTTKVGPGPKTTNIGPGPKTIIKVGPGPKTTNIGPGPKTTTKVGPGPKTTTKIGPGPKTTTKIGPGPKTTTKIGPGPKTTTKVGPGPKTTKVGPGPKTTNIGKTTNVRIPKNVTIINKRNVSVFRDRRRVWVGGFWRTFVPIVALGGLYIGSQYYDPEGYVALARPYCSGVSEEGYSLRWQEVPVEGGGTEWQCVQFRPRVQTVDLPPPPPPQTLVTPAPVPPPAAGTCEITVYSEPNFGGMSSPATENLSSLEEEGWKYEIASVQVIAGTWEFYAEDDFTGDSMRLPPGSHGDLGEWTKRIASLMCIEPSAKGRLSAN